MQKSVKGTVVAGAYHDWWIVNTEPKWIKYFSIRHSVFFIRFFFCFYILGFCVRAHISKGPSKGYTSIRKIWNNEHLWKWCCVYEIVYYFFFFFSTFAHIEPESTGQIPSSFIVFSMLVALPATLNIEKQWHISTRKWVRSLCFGGEKFWKPEQAGYPITSSLINDTNMHNANSVRAPWTKIKPKNNDVRLALSIVIFG